MVVDRIETGVRARKAAVAVDERGEERRLKALEYALLGPHSALSAHDVIERARVFERYVRDGGDMSNDGDTTVFYGDAS
jgi:hypothetical protein